MYGLALMLEQVLAVIPHVPNFHCGVLGDVALNAQRPFVDFIRTEMWVNRDFRRVPGVELAKRKQTAAGRPGIWVVPVGVTVGANVFPNTTGDVVASFRKML